MKHHIFDHFPSFPEPIKSALEASYAKACRHAWEQMQRGATVAWAQDGWGVWRLTVGGRPTGIHNL